MVYDKKHRLIVLFGGDAQDSALSDTWVFDVVKQQWEMRRPKQSPYPRSCHAMVYLDGSGVVLLAGGRVVADYRRQRALSEQVWAYDAGPDVWTPVAAKPPAIEGHEWYSMENVPGTDEVLLVVTSQYDHRQVTYRFRYDPTASPASEVKLAQIEGVPPGTVAFKTERTPEWYADVPPADPAPEATPGDLPGDASVASAGSPLRPGPGADAPPALDRPWCPGGHPVPWPTRAPLGTGTAGPGTTTIRSPAARTRLISLAAARIALTAGPPPAPASIPLLLISYFLAWLINFCTSALIGLAAFAFEEVAPLDWIYHKLLLVAGGVLIPLDFFPEWLREICQSLPFAYTIYGPARFFIDPSWQRFVTLILGQLGWIIVMATLLTLVYRPAYASYSGLLVWVMCAGICCYLAIMLGLLLLITYVPWISLVLTRFVE